MSVTSGGRSAEQIKSRLRMNRSLRRRCTDVMAPGTTVIVTDEKVARKPRGAAILES